MRSRLWRNWRWRAAALSAATLLLLTAWHGAGGGALAGNKPLLWKPSEQALLRVDNHPLAEWNVYQDGKKTNPLLVQMGPRFLFVDGREKQIFEIPLAKVEHKGSDVLWDPADRPEKPLETSEWLVKDVGLAYKISVKLAAEGHVLDVQIPHPLDLRSIH